MKHIVYSGHRLYNVMSNADINKHISIEMMLDNQTETREIDNEKYLDDHTMMTKQMPLAYYMKRRETPKQLKIAIVSLKICGQQSDLKTFIKKKILHQST